LTEDGVAYDALIQFLYQAPVGLLRLEMDGEIILINPMAAALLMPLAPAGALVNLFDVLAPLAPDLRERAMAHAEVGSAVGGGTVRIPVANASGCRTPVSLAPGRRCWGCGWCGSTQARGWRR